MATKKHHPPILPKHRIVPDWRTTTIEESSENVQKIREYFQNPETGQVDEDHPEFEQIFAIIRAHTHPDVLDRVNGGYMSEEYRRTGVWPKPAG